MGTLRTIFAIAVVFAHAGVYMFVGGQNAVQLFYMISGFLISYILVEKKAYPDLKRFYINRFLRLYPLYATVSAMTLTAYFGGVYVYPEFFDVYKTSPLAAKLLLLTSNIVLFFQDWVMFAGVTDGGLVFAKDFSQSVPPLYRGLLVPQAWTLGVEMTFYLIAPFVLPRRQLIYILLAGSLALRLIFIEKGFGLKDPWSYRFFPTELALFLLGSLAHQILLPMYKKRLGLDSSLPCAAATAVLVTASLIYSEIPLSGGANPLVLFALFLALMPMAFMFQGESKVDKWIGDLSYPIYICHLLVIAVLLPMEAKIRNIHPMLFAILCVVVSTIFAICLNRFVGAKLERLRDRFKLEANPNPNPNPNPNTNTKDAGLQSGAVRA